MSIHTILNVLQKVKKTGAGRYTAICPVHQDRKPSLAITEASNGSVLVHCFACGANGVDVCNAVGVDPTELFPPRPDNHDYRNVRKKPEFLFSDRQLLECIEHEATVVAACAHLIINGKQLSQSDIERVDLAYKRITSAVHYQHKRENEWGKRISKYQQDREIINEFREFGEIRGIGEPENVH